MTKLLEIKDQLIRFYSKYETYLYPIVKFAVALALFTVINTNIGFMEKISRFPVALLLVHMGMGVDAIWWAVSGTTIAKGLILTAWFVLIKRKIL